MADVDTTIHPHATGAAADLVQKHRAEQPLKLYGAWFCPFVQRAWVVLVEKAIPHQYIEVNPYRKEAEFLALNPRGLVPSLGVPVGKGTHKALYESVVICEYLDEAFTSSARRLLDQADDKDAATAAYERAYVRLWIDHISTRIVPAFYRLLQHTSDKAYSLESARAQLHEHLLAFAGEMADGGPWFLGERFSLVDVMLAPWAQRLWLIDHYKTGGTGIPEPGEGGRDEVRWVRWRAWLHAVLERPSVKATTSDAERYVDVYKRYAEDTTQSGVALATRQGTRLP